MNSIAQSTLSWLWQMTWQAAALAILVGILTRLLRRWLAPQARQLLWMLVFVRLAMPVLPGSSFSLLRLLEMPGREEASVETPRPLPYFFESSARVISPMRPAAGTFQPPRPKPWMRWDLAAILALWAFGTVATIWCVTVSTRRFRRRLARTSTQAGSRIIEVVRSCCDEVGVRPPSVLLTDAINTPSVFGIFRPKLLLPKSIVRQLDPASLRAVVLHELEHLRRRHLLGEWVMLIIRAVHWFNPAAWIAHRNIRAARELICDRSVLSRLDERTAERYGQTLLDIAEGLSRSARLPMLAALVSRRGLLRERVELIADRGGRPVAGLGIILALVLGVGCLTKPRTAEPAPSTLPALVATTRPAGKQIALAAYFLEEDASIAELIGVRRDPPDQISSGPFKISDDAAAALLKKINAHDIKTLATPRLLLVDGQPGQIQIGTNYTYVADYSAKTDAPGQTRYVPIIKSGLDGISFECTAHPYPDGKYLRLRLHPAVTKLIEMHSEPWKNAGGNPQNLKVQFPMLSTRDISTSYEVADGEWIVMRLGRSGNEQAGGQKPVIIALSARIITPNADGTIDPAVADLIAEATRLIDAGQFDQAGPILDQILKIDPENSYAKKTKGLLEDLAAHPLPPALAADQAARQQLEKRLPELHFDGVAFADVIDFLHDVASINISANWKALAAVGVTGEEKVSARLSNVKFGKALDTILKEVGDDKKVKLAYTIDQGVLAISTAADLAGPMVTAVYDMRDLLEVGQAVAPAENTRTHLVNDLITLIEATISPDSWNEKDGGHIRELAGQFIITQTPDNQAQIHRLIGQLREARAVQISLEVQEILLTPTNATALRSQFGIGNLRAVPGERSGEIRSAAAALGAKTTSLPRIILFNGQGRSFGAQLEEPKSPIYLAATASTDHRSVDVQFHTVDVPERRADAKPGPTTLPGSIASLVSPDFVYTVADDSAVLLIPKAAMDKAFDETWLIVHPKVIVQHERDTPQP